MQTTSSSPSWRIKAGLACCSLIFTYACIEIGYRYVTARKFVAGDYGITVLSGRMVDPNSPGYFVTNSKIKYKVFDAAHNLVKENVVVTNNHGFISGNSYSIEKPVEEFRIVVLGDSLTACETNDFPWADVLERRLKDDVKLKSALGAKSIRVLNLGLSGSGFPMMLYNFVRYGEQFQPDLVVVNYIEDDFFREIGSEIESLAKTAENNRTAASQVPKSKGYVQVGGAEVFVHSPSDAPSLSDSDVVPSRMFIMDDDLALDKTRVMAVKSDIASTMLRHRLWLTVYPHALARMFGREFSLDYHRYQSSGLAPSNDVATTRAAKCLSELRSRHPRVLLLQNPLQPELLPLKSPECTVELRKKSPDLRIIEMASYLPLDKGPSEVASWYNLPHDGHWSNHGAEVYAEAIHQALAQVLPGFLRSSPAVVESSVVAARQDKNR